MALETEENMTTKNTSKNAFKNKRVLRPASFILALIMIAGTIGFAPLSAVYAAAATLTFTTSPASAAVVLQDANGAAIAPDAGGKVFSVTDGGTYYYKVSEPNSVTQFGSVAVNGSTSKTITLLSNQASSLTLTASQWSDHKNPASAAQDMYVNTGSGYIEWIRNPCWVKYSNVNLLGGITKAVVNIARSGGTNDTATISLWAAPAGSTSPTSNSLAAGGGFSQIARNANFLCNTGGWGSPGKDVDLGAVSANGPGISDLYVYFEAGEINYSKLTLTLAPMASTTQYYDVTFSTRPYDAAVSVTSLDGTPVSPDTAGGKVYSHLQEGFYRYTVSDGGYVTKSDVLIADHTQRLLTVLIPENSAYARYESEDVAAAGGAINNAKVQNENGFSQGANTGGNAVGSFGGSTSATPDSEFSNIGSVKYIIPRDTTGIVEVKLWYSSSSTPADQPDRILYKVNAGAVQTLALNRAGAGVLTSSTIFVDMQGGSNALYVSNVRDPRYSNGGNAWVNQDCIDVNKATIPGSVDPNEADSPTVQPFNPIFKNIFTADCEAHVWPTDPNTVYFYPSHDPYPPSGSGRMDMYHVFKTQNMVNFQDQGEILRRSDIPTTWAQTPPAGSSDRFMWAPDACYNPADGYYYYYWPTVRDVTNWGSTWETGVVRSRYPDHGFEQIPASDTLTPASWQGFILGAGATAGFKNMYDVCVRVYDGQAYIYVGAAQHLYMGKLDKDMVTVMAPGLQLVTTDQTSEAVGTDANKLNALVHYHEGPTSFYRTDDQGKGHYYLVYPGGGDGSLNYINKLSGDYFYYAMADSPMGPWANAKAFFAPTGCGTEHGSIFQFRDKWYLTYHTNDLPDNGGCRSVHVGSVGFNADGTIIPFGKSPDGPGQNGPDYVQPAPDCVLGADDAVFAGANVTKSNDSSAGNGGGIITNLGPTGSSVTFSNVDGGVGGRARLIFHYSTTDDLPKLNLNVSGVDYNVVNFPKTGGRSFFSTAQFTTRPLSPGKMNTITLTGINDGKLTLNYIEVLLLDEPGIPVTPGDDSFYSSFESTDPAINVQPAESSGVSATAVKTTSLVHEYANYAAANPVTLNETLTYGSASETEINLIDRSTATKLCATSFNAATMLPLDITFAFDSAIAPQAYYISGGNDDMTSPNRVLSAWTLLGSNNNTDWVALDSRSGVAWTSNQQVQLFQFANAVAYKYFRLSITAKGNPGSTNENVLQFSGFGLGDGVVTNGTDGPVNYLWPQIATGPAYNWGSPMANRGWTGASSLLVSGVKTDANAKSYSAIYDNLDVQVYNNTKLSYMVFPDINLNYTSTAGNNYDFEYTGSYAAIDLQFSDGTRLKDYGVADQYGDVVSPLAQGGSNVLVTNNWLHITSDLGKYPGLVGKHISKILVGFEKNGGTPGKAVRTYFDDMSISRQDDPVITNLADYTDILRGTYSSGNNPSRGLNAPIVATPYPFNFWCPATELNNQTPYVYNGADANFKHIKITHVASNWIGDSGAFDFSADSTTAFTTAAALNTALGSRGSGFLHKNETAHAYYYGVTLNANDAKAPGVKIEVTPTEHAAVLRFTFPAGAAKRNVILDCAETLANSAVQYTSGNTFTAYSSREQNGMRRMYISGEFSVTPTAFDSAGGGNNGARSMFEFPAAASGPTVVELKVATSFMSASQAAKNLSLEIAPADSFDTVEARALNTWNGKLSAVELQGGTFDQLQTFYSNLYRTMVYPCLLGENTGTADAPHMQYTSPYSGTDAALTIKDGYLMYNMGFWDVYRTSWPLYSILTPNNATYLLNGLVQHYKDQGWLPRWIAPAGTNSMVGTNSDNVFGDAISRGVNFDYQNAYMSALRNASVYSVNNTSNWYSGRSGLDQSVFLGYYPSVNTSDENLSWSIEGYVADFGVANMAKALRDKETQGTGAWQKYNDEYLYFLNRADSFVNVFNPAAGGWLRARQANGSWLQTDAAFSPTPFGYGYTEGNAWDYAFTAMQDGLGLANLYGGRAALGDKLDLAFSTQGVVDVGTWSGHKENWEGRWDKLGMVKMSNQPAHAIPYMYLFSDRPWKTAATVRDIMDRLYAGSDVGQGYIGDDDNGEMSAWYVLSALGMFPLTNGNGDTALGTPLFTKAVIHRDNGDTITVNAPNVSRTNKYVQGVRINGAAYDKTYIDPSLMKDGLTIDFSMGSSPSGWGTADSAMPPSITAGSDKPAPMTDLTTAVTPSATDLPTGFVDGAYTNGASPAAMFSNSSASYTSWGAGSKFVIYYFNKGATVNMYTITDATAATAPAAWTLSGSVDGQTWKTLDTRANQVFQWDRYTRPFAIGSPARYKYYKLEFTDTAASVNVAQLELLGGVNAMVSKDALLETINAAKAVNGNLYAPETYQPVLGALAAAQAVYGDDYASDADIANAISGLERAMSGLIAIKPAQILFNGVDCNYASDGVKKESTSGVTGVISGNVTNLGGLTPGSYVGFRYVDFGSGQYWWTDAKVIYAGKQADLSNSRIVVHLDALDGPVIADFGVTATGADWSVYAYASGALTQNDITGLHTVYYEFRGNGISVANINAFVFGYTAPPDLGKIINALTPDSLTTSLKYQNDSGTARDLTLVTAVYTNTGKLTYIAKDAQTVPASQIADFEAVINAPGLMDECLRNDYSVSVFLWDTDTLAPVMAAFKSQASAIAMRQQLDAAKAAIEAGAYKIPGDLTGQAEKTAWVQARVNSYIPAGNPTVATVTFDGTVYSVGLANGSVTGSAAIAPTQSVTVTFSAPDADGGYYVTRDVGPSGTAALPADPVRTGYKFLGWYISRAGGDWKFTANTAVTVSAVVSAKWIVAPASSNAVLVFDNPVFSSNLTYLPYSTSGENGTQPGAFHDDTVGAIDPSQSRYLYCQIPVTFPDLRNARDVAFDITYYDVGTTTFMFETGQFSTGNNYNNRFFIPRSNTGELVTYTIYVSDAMLSRGQNGGGDFRFRGEAQNVYIKSIVVRAGTQPTLDSYAPPNFAPQTSANNMIGKTLAGYQMWFTSSPTNSGWVHWSRGTRPTTPAQITFENWPDVREYPAAALNDSGLPALANGSPAQLFTSKLKDVVDLHFSWIQQYGIDGVAVQRFSGEAVTAPTPTKNYLSLVQDAAERTGKTFYIMYDLSNCNNTTVVGNIEKDWVYSIEQKGLVSSPNYAHAYNKPVVCLWGLSGVASQSDGNVYITQANALALISWFHGRGYYVIGGTPDNDWATKTDDYELVYRALDMISPWTVGRYGRSQGDIIPWLDAHVPRELAYCAQYGIAYQPVIFAGFNWSNLQPYPPNEVPRYGGEMMWTQAKYLKNKGINTAYFAMLDEYDEGSGLLKTAEDSSMLPLGTTPYFNALASDGNWVSSDFYLRLAGAVTGLLRNGDASVSMDAPLPVPRSLGPVYWRDGFEQRYQIANARYAGGYNNVDVCLYHPAVLQLNGVTNPTQADVMENGHAGTAFSLSFGGTSASAASSYDYKIADTSILVPANLQLSYWINAQNDLGRSVYVNVQFSDGTLLSQKAGFVQKKPSAAGAWEQIAVDFDASLAGKTITGVVVSYANGAAGDYAANIDDIVIQAKP